MAGIFSYCSCLKCGCIGFWESGKLDLGLDEHLFTGFTGLSSVSSFRPTLTDCYHHGVILLAVRVLLCIHYIVQLISRFLNSYILLSCATPETSQVLL